MRELSFNEIEAVDGAGVLGDVAEYFGGWGSAGSAVDVTGTALSGGSLAEVGAAAGIGAGVGIALGVAFAAGWGVGTGIYATYDWIRWG